jgi:hypothetical protein
MTKSPGASPSSLSGVDAQVRGSTRQCCRGVERIRVSRRAATFSHWPRRIGSVGTRGPSRGVSGAQRGLRHEGAVQGRWERGREQNEGERVVGKAAGDECVFIPGEGPSWQMKSG